MAPPALAPAASLRTPPTTPRASGSAFSSPAFSLASLSPFLRPDGDDNRCDPSVGIRAMRPPPALAVARPAKRRFAPSLPTLAPDSPSVFPDLVVDLPGTPNGFFKKMANDRFVWGPASAPSTPGALSNFERSITPATDETSSFFSIDDRSWGGFYDFESDAPNSDAPKRKTKRSEEKTGGADKENIAPRDDGQDNWRFQGFDSLPFPETPGFKWGRWKSKPVFNRQYGSLTEEVQIRQIKQCLKKPSFRQSLFFKAVKKTFESGKNNWMYTEEFRKYHGIERSRTKNNFNNGVMFLNPNTAAIIPSRPQCFMTRVDVRTPAQRGNKQFKINPVWLTLYAKYANEIFEKQD